MVKKEVGGEKGRRERSGGKRRGGYRGQVREGGGGGGSNKVGRGRGVCEGSRKVVEV